MLHRFDPHPDPDQLATPRRWWRLLLARRATGSRPPSSGTSPSRSVADEGRVDHLVDPDGTVVLFRLSGDVSARTIRAIAEHTASLDRRHTVHLDLHDATIPSVRVVVELEQLADRLERAMVRIRMVGLDPDHPALDARR